MSTDGRLPRLERLEAVVVDLDGTMVDTLGDLAAALNAMLAELGLAPIDRKFVARTVGKGSEHLVRSALEQAGGAGPLDTARALFERHYSETNGRHATVYPGVIAGLTALRGRGLALACLTNKPTAFALPLLRQLRLDGFFRRVFGGDAFARQKPDPLPLLCTCEALRTAPAATLMVGDSSNDARAARAAGCPVVLVRYGYNHGEPVASLDVDGWVDGLDELPALLHF